MFERPTVEMREDHHEIQTPKKELLQLSSNRKEKSFNSQSKKLNHPQQKIVKKSLTSVFTSITENDAVVDLSEKESIQISSISASVDEDQSTVEISKSSVNSDHTQVSDNTVALQHPEVSVGSSSVSDAFVSDEDQSSESIQSSVKSASVEMSPLSSTMTVEMTPTTPEAAAVFGTSDGATTVEMTIMKELAKSMIKGKSKKFLDELGKMGFEECYDLHEERGMFSRKEMIVLLSFVLGILAVSARFFLLTDVQSSYYGPPPT